MQWEFTVDIRSPSAHRFTRNGHTYVSLDNYSEYSIVISNNHHTRCDAVVHVDGKEIGTWAIHAYTSITLDRPANTRRRFTFVSETSQAAKRTGAIVGHELNGIVSVIFKPAKMQPVYQAISYSTQRSSSPRRMASPRSSSPSRMSSPPGRTSYGMSSPRRMSSGVTVLGDRSDQTFGTERALEDREIDWPLSTEISLRLVVNDDKYAPLTSSSYPPRLNWKNKMYD